jgi:hypothetical protein
LVSGFENFAAMRDDPALCFLKRCGPSGAFGSERESKDVEETNGSDKNAEESDANEQPPEPVRLFNHSLSSFYHSF